MSKRQRQVERRIVQLSEDELEKLIALLARTDKLRRRLVYVRNEFKDAALRLKELEARERANAFWVEDNGVERPLKRRGKNKLACPSAKEVKRLIEQQA